MKNGVPRPKKQNSFSRIFVFNIPEMIYMLQTYQQQHLPTQSLSKISPSKFWKFYSLEWFDGTVISDIWPRHQDGQTGRVDEDQADGALQEDGGTTCLHPLWQSRGWPWELWGEYCHWLVLILLVAGAEILIHESQGQKQAETELCQVLQQLQFVMIVLLTKWNKSSYVIGLISIGLCPYQRFLSPPLPPFKMKQKILHCK